MRSVSVVVVVVVVVIVVVLLLLLLIIISCSRCINNNQLLPSLYCCIVVLLYCCIVVLLYCCIVVLLYVTCSFLGVDCCCCSLILFLLIMVPVGTYRTFCPIHNYLRRPQIIKIDRKAVERKRETLEAANIKIQRDIYCYVLYPIISLL
jgi:hypothetical protein